MAKTTKKNLPDDVSTVAIPPEDPPAAPEELEPTPQTTPDEEYAAAYEGMTDPDAPQPEPEAKRKPGRPKSDPNKPVEDIWDVIAKMKPGDKIYVYRLAPITNRLMSGTRNVNIKIWDKPFDAEELMDYAGSGCYQIQFTQKQPDGTNKRIRIDEVKCLDMNRPPRIPLGEWLKDPRNEEWKWAEELILKKNDPKPDPYLTIMEKQMERQHEEMQQLRREMAAEQGKVHPLVTLFAPFVPAIVAKITAPPPALPPAPDPMASITAAATLLKSLQPSAPPPNPLEPIMLEIVKAKLSGNEETALTKLIELKKQLAELDPPAEHRSRMSGTQELIAEGIKNLGPALGPVLAMMMNPPRPPQPGQPQQQFIPAPQQQQAPPPARPQQQGPGPQLVKTSPTVAAFANAAKEHLEQGKSGEDLAAWFIDTFGRDEFLDVRIQGKAEVMRLILSDQAASHVLNTFVQNGKLEEIVTDFLLCEPSDEEEDDEDEAPPMAGANPWANPAPIAVEVQQ